MYKPSRMMILLMAMLVLLPLLATLQYRWLGQVSDAATERLQSSLRVGATQFRRDFNREFIRAYVNFQIDSGAVPNDSEQFHIERFERWTKTAPYPRLVSDVFEVRYDEQRHPFLSHLNANAKRFESAEWSGQFLNLRDRFERLAETAQSSGQAPRGRSIEPFAEEIPALIIPFPLVSAKDGQNPSLPSGFTIVKLDLNYLQHEFIPSLIQRQFFDDSRNEYNLAIISIRHPERVIYSSSNPTVDLSSNDASTRIFGLEPDELRAFLRSEAASLAGGEQSATRQLRLINLDLKVPAVDSATSSGGEDGHWLLMIKHQTGSLAAAVSGARHRNLAISFGILLLLGAGILMTVISIGRAERLARQQINFVAGVTHELRTPLAVICSAGENLADGVVDGPEKAAHYGRVIWAEGRRLTEMVEQVLEFAGAQSGRLHHELKPTDVADLIADALAACRGQIQEREFDFETAIDPDLPPIRGNAPALKRAIQNLISNAIKYAGETRWARVSARMRGGRRGNEVRITVEDRGLGISSSDIAHVFEPFYRGHEAVSAQIEGSGIGLSLVKQIVEAHDGSVTVKSTLGAGSVFTVDLPLVARAGELREEMTKGDKS